MSYRASTHKYGKNFVFPVFVGWQKWGKAPLLKPPTKASKLSHGAYMKNKISKKEIRKRRVELTLSDKEYETLKQKSGGIPLARFLRDWSISGEIPVKKERKTELPKINPELMRKITSMTNNLNQLTRYAHMENNQGNSIDILSLAFNIDKMQKELRELREFYTIGDIK